jgi:hypothetical protein
MPPRSTLSWIGRAAALAAIVLLAGARAGQAATVFFYSEPEQYYGWAAGYNYNRSEREAHDACEEGGSQCKFVLECDGGWSAIAFADDRARGVGFSCGLANPFGAFTMALATCIAQSGTLCWTNATISNNARELSAEQNRASDRAYYAQQMLYALDLYAGDVDGRLGGKTRAALKAFQVKLGLEPTGELDDALFERLLDAMGGRAGLARAVRDMVEKESKAAAEHAYAHAEQPYAVAGFSEEIAQRPDEARRLTLATVLSNWGTKCTLPAKSAEPVPADGSGGWWVTCDEGEWTVSWTDKMHLIANGHISITSGDGAASGEADRDGTRKASK